MHYAGYDMEEAYKMWERISNIKSSNNKFEFFSTHPSNKTRIENIKSGY